MDERTATEIPDLPEWVNKTPQETLETASRAYRTTVTSDEEVRFDYELAMRCWVDHSSNGDAQLITLSRAEFMALKRYLVQVRIAEALRETADSIESGESNPNPSEAIERYAQALRDNLDLDVTYDEEPEPAPPAAETTQEVANAAA